LATLGNLSVANLTVVGSTSLVGNVTFPNINVTTTAVVGKLNSAGNIHVTGGNLTVSTDATAVAFANSAGLTNSLLTISKSANAFIQTAMTNRSSGTSASVLTLLPMPTTAPIPKATLTWVLPAQDSTILHTVLPKLVTDIFL
jgi:hypothetical protein